MKLLITYFFVFLGLFTFAQRTIETKRITEKITIDGEFKEGVWDSVPFQNDFTVFIPNPGVKCFNQTDVKMLYDDYAIYFAVVCHDSPDSISNILSQRDDFNSNIDNFQIILDTYNDDQNAFIFGVSSMGSQYDSRISNQNDNPSMNMVWNSAVERTDQGWQIEFKIPYSAIRFPNKDVQDWGINFYRHISRSREESTWNPVQPDNNNFVAQSGTLLNLKGIVPPLRLALIPYVSAYADHYPTNSPDASNWSGSFNGGMDIKLGLNEAFTLDMTLVPDFGQVVFDNQVLNLSPFEVQFNENRQFFTEGMDLFNKSGLFYSRRIGVQAPFDVLGYNLKENEILENVPANAQLYNATKLSGRTNSGLGIGVFNAVTAKQTAIAHNLVTDSLREVVVSPLTNFNVVVLDQNLKNNSFINVTNTNVTRLGGFYDANVIGLTSKFNTKDNKYYFAGSTNTSLRFDNSSITSGSNWGFETGKQTGKWVMSSGYFEESASYDPNDLGYNQSNNKRILSGSASYRIFKPVWKLNQMIANLNFTYNRLYSPNVYTGTFLNAFLFSNTRKFHGSGLEMSAALTKRYDYFEPREAGRYFVRPKYIYFGGFISSNYQKRFALDVNVFYTLTDSTKWSERGYRISPRLRITNKLFLILDHDVSFTFKEYGYAVQFGNPVVLSEGIVFGKRDRTNTVNTINLNYTMSPKMGVTFRLRHYRSSIEYFGFYDLLDNGHLESNSMTGIDSEGNSAYNTNFNAFTIDFVYRWVFLPGSEINIVWKNSIFSNDLRVHDNYTTNLTSLFEYSPLNSFSIKVLYWLDAQKFKKR